MNTKIKLCVWMGLFGWGFSVWAGSGVAPGLFSFLASVQEGHPYFRAESLRARIQEKVYESSAGGESWVLESSPGYRYDEPVSSSVFSPEDVENVKVDLRLSRPVWKTGGRFSVGGEYDYTSQTSPVFPSSEGEAVPTGLPRFYQHGVFASYVQPLMRNRGGDLSRLDADVQALLVDMTALGALENQEGFLLELGQAYLDWAFRRSQVDVVEAREALALEQVEKTREQRAANLVDEVDLLRAEDGLRLAQLRAMQVRSTLKSVQARLEAESAFALPADSGVDFLASPKDLLASMDGVASFESSRTLRAILLDQDRLLRVAKGLASSSEPELNLEVSGGLRGGDASYDEALGFDHPEFRVGLVYRYPLGNVSSQADRERNELLLEESRARFESAQRALESRRDVLGVELAEMVGLLELNLEQVASAARRTEAESARYDQGRSPLTFVIDSRDNEAESRSRYIETAYGFYRLQLSLMALQDRLFPGK